MFFGTLLQFKHRPRSYHGILSHIQIHSICRQNTFANWLREITECRSLVRKFMGIDLGIRCGFAVQSVSLAVFESIWELFPMFQWVSSMVVFVWDGRTVRIKAQTAARSESAHVTKREEDSVIAIARSINCTHQQILCYERRAENSVKSCSWS